MGIQNIIRRAHAVKKADPPSPAPLDPEIEIDNPIIGTASITRDTATGLDWLDLTQSSNRSFHDVVHRQKRRSRCQRLRIRRGVRFEIARNGLTLGGFLAISAGFGIPFSVVS